MRAKEKPVQLVPLWRELARNAFLGCPASKNAW
jgi:hypothetical protein